MLNCFWKCDGDDSFCFTSHLYFDVHFFSCVLLCQFLRPFDDEECIFCHFFLKFLPGLFCELMVSVEAIKIAMNDFFSIFCCVFPDVGKAGAFD